MDRDPSLDTLLDLDGVVIGGLAGGHWVKFDVRRVPATANRPHGIRYSFTLILFFRPEVDAILGGR